MEPIRQKKFTLLLTAEDLLDVMLLTAGRDIVKFSLNYRALIRGRWVVIYRIDNFHGFLHEQKFWISPEPIALGCHEGLPLNFVFAECQKQIKEKFLKYKMYFISRKTEKK